MKATVKINITKGTITDFIARNTRLNLKELIEKAVINYAHGNYDNGSYDTTVGRLMLGCNQHKKTKRFVCNLFDKLKENGICICNPDGVAYSEEEFLRGEVDKDSKIRVIIYW